MTAVRAFVPFGFALLLASCLLLLVGSVAQSWPMSPRLAYAIAFVIVSAELLVAAHLVPLPSARSTTLILGATLIVMVSVRSLAPTPLPAALLTLGLLAGSAVLGGLIGSRIEKPGHLLAVVAISALADLWSVYDPAGPSAKLAEQAAAHPDKLVLFALPWPMLGTKRIEAIIGAGDILFAALYSTALRRHGLHALRVAIAMGASLMLGLLLLLQYERALPLLPLMGAAVLLAEPEARSLPVQDRRSVMVVVFVLSAFLVYRFAR